MAAAEEKKEKEETEFYIQVRLGYFRGIFKVCKLETVRVLKERIADFLNINGHVPQIGLTHTVDADSFQLRDDLVRDIVMEDAKMIGDYLQYKFRTPAVIVLIYDENGNVPEIIDLPHAPPRDSVKGERESLREKAKERSREEYAALLKKE